MPFRNGRLLGNPVGQANTKCFDWYRRGRNPGKLRCRFFVCSATSECVLREAPNSLIKGIRDSVSILVGGFAWFLVFIFGR